ncbi:TetR/AcrR family transcriptional regulator [Glycomyces arizonensis]|uniref:TetR/AcrR family transcriptional regulator n=1 Tax=Glycomyces arizonensis TaxID=256035 RepID=UPI00047D7B65|nr:WHG domain-containing protein [Glycomyces arizonensis]
MNAPRTARERARAELTREILAAARRQLGEVGPSALSLRAVARELEMASSAIYRYFKSRDELLTALILAAYNDIGDAAESADDPAAEPAERWTAIWRGVRAWALDNPHEFALLFGTPVPGYAAPQETAAAAGRMPLALARVVADAKAAGVLDLPPAPPCDPALIELDLTTLLPDVVFTAEETARILLAWNRLVGIVSYELHGHLVGVTADDAGFFDYAARTSGAFAGLPL